VIPDLLLSVALYGLLVGLGYMVGRVDQRARRLKQDTDSLRRAAWRTTTTRRLDDDRR
jgi:hypothetical protein